MTNIEHYPDKSKTQQLKSSMDVLADRKSEWSEIGLFILEVERDHSWREVSPTFTSWLDLLAARVGVQRSSLWKYRAAVLIGVDLLGLSHSEGRDSVISKLSRTKADMLETLKKIADVAPKEVASRLITDVFDGRVSRTELREMWKVYKGADSDRPKASAISEDCVSLAKAGLISGLVTAGSSWLNPGQGASGYKVFPDLVVYQNGQATVQFDCVIATKRDLDNPELQLHGFIVWDKKAVSTAVFGADFCNFIWCLTNSAQALPLLPVNVGIVRVSNNSVSVVRPATQGGRLEQVGLCAKAVLLRIL